MINLSIKFEVSMFAYYDDMKETQNVEIGVVSRVQGHSRSLAILTFDRTHITSYSTLAETICLS